MRVLGLDLGTCTLGVSISDRTNTIATPLKVIRFQKEDYDFAFNEVKKLVKEQDITDIALGLPKNMDNSLGFAAKRSMDFKELLDTLSVNVHLIDERLSSVEAFNILKTTGNKNIKNKHVIDAVAANIILENYLRGIKK
ncbi:MAG: Holliday junction resolvase RuvX [Bacilli bacterium]